MECSLAVLLGYMDIQSLQMLYKTSRRFLFTGESSVWDRALGHAALEIDKVMLEGMGSLRLRMDFLQRRLHLGASVHCGATFAQCSIGRGFLGFLFVDDSLQPRVRAGQQQPQARGYASSRSHKRGV